MRFNKYFLAIALMSASAQCLAAEDSGKIVEVYTHPGGMMALRLDNGLSNSVQERDCGSGANGWAGVEATADPSIKSGILAAYVSRLNVTLVTMGECVGAWIKIEAMHLRQ